MVVIICCSLVTLLVSHLQIVLLNKVSVGKWQRLEKNLRTDIRLSTSLVELALAQHHLMEIPSAKSGR
jgi:hypothetical protein